MRVLMATMKLDIGGAETHIVELSKALKRRGVEVLIASNGGAYVKELEEAGIPHFEVGMHTKNPFSMMRAYKKLKRIIRENKIDIIHAHARIPAFLCGLLHKKYNYRFVTTAHWVFSTVYWYRVITNWGQRSLAVSEDIKQYLVDNYGTNADNIKVTINGVDTKKFSPDVDFSEVAKEFEFGPDKKRVVYVSRMDEDRSLAAHKLIEAVPGLYAKVPNLEVVIVGGGNDFDAVNKEAQAVNQSLGSRVIITTNSRVDINKFVASGDVFVGVSRAALEAMACKKPAIIAGNEGYIGIFDKDKLEVAIDTNFCCRGCRQITTDLLRDDLIKLLDGDKAELCRELGEFSFETVQKYYSVETMASDAISLYISAIKDSNINRVNAEAELEDIDSYLIHGNCKRDIDVMVSGYYGFDNSGDDCILEAIIQSLREKSKNIRIVVLSNNPEETAEMYEVEAVDRFDFLTIRKVLKKTRLLISGGGSLIQDVTSTKSLWYYLTIIRMAKRCGAKVMLYANGIGPIKRKSNARRVQKIIKKIDAITLREGSSLKELKRIAGKDVSAQITADPVFGMEFESGEVVDNAIIRGCLDPKDKFFVITVREWEANDLHIERKIAEFSKYVYEEYGILAFIIPMQTKLDRKISENIDVRLDFRHGICRNGYPPEVLMGIISRAEFVLGMRLHTLIYAVKVGVPTIALDYDPKVAAVMKAIDLKYSMKVEDIDVEQLKSFVDDIVKDRAVLVEALKNKSQSFSELAKNNTEIAIELLKG